MRKAAQERDARGDAELMGKMLQSLPQWTVPNDGIMPVEAKVFNAPQCPQSEFNALFFDKPAHRNELKRAALPWPPFVRNLRGIDAHAMNHHLFRRRAGLNQNIAEERIDRQIEGPKLEKIPIVLQASIVQRHADVVTMENRDERCGDLAALFQTRDPCAVVAEMGNQNIEIIEAADRQSVQCG
jgi:hypothetical protein